MRDSLPSASSGEQSPPSDKLSRRSTGGPKDSTSATNSGEHPPASVASPQPPTNLSRRSTGGEKVALPLVLAAEQRRLDFGVTDLGGGCYELSGRPTRAGAHHLVVELLGPLEMALDEGRQKGSPRGARQPSVGRGGGRRVAEGAAAEGRVALFERGDEAAADEARGVVVTLQVLAAEASAPLCLVSGESLTHAYEMAEAAFVCQAVDMFGNWATLGGERFELRGARQVKGEEEEVEVSHAVEDNGDGTYIVRYIVKEAGQVQLGLWLLPRRAAAPPPLSRRASSVRSMARASIPAAQEEEEAGEQQAELVGGRTWNVLVRSRAASTLASHEIVAEMENHARASLAQLTHASGPGVEQAVAGEPVTFVVTLPSKMTAMPPGSRPPGWADVERRALQTARLKVSGVLTRPAGCAAPPSLGSPPRDFKLLQMVDRGDGSFSVSYAARTSGALALHVELMGGGPIRGSPFAVRVCAGALDPAKCTAAGAGLERCVVTERSEFSIFPKDKNGNVRLRGNDAPRWGRDDRRGAEAERFQVEISPADGGERALTNEQTTDIEIGEGESGALLVRYTLCDVGAYRLAVLCAGVPIVGSPFRLRCEAGPFEPSASSLLELQAETIHAGGPLRRLSAPAGRFWVQTRDRFANARERPVEWVPWCELRREAHKPLLCSARDMGDGRLEFSYAPGSECGLWQIWIGHAAARPRGEAAGREESTVLGDLLIEPALSFGPTCVFSPTGQLKVQTKVLYEIFVTSTDEAARPRLFGGELARLTLSSGPGPLALDITDLSNGTYRIAFSVQVSGEYRAVITVDGRPVSGSPISLVAPRGESPRSVRNVNGGSWLGTSSGRTPSPRREASPRGSPKRGNGVAFNGAATFPGTLYG
ncbi:hypothetical protein AB1Y20_003204 [Prymnesium parvum]